jgi:hypothetical protein
MNQADELVSYKIKWIEPPEHLPVTIKVTLPDTEEPPLQIFKVVKAP